MDRTQFPRDLFVRVLGMCRLEALLNLCDVSESVRAIAVDEIRRRFCAHSAEFAKVKPALALVRETVFRNLPDEAFVEALGDKIGQACEECGMRWSVFHHGWYHMSLCLECLRSDDFALVSARWLTKHMWLPRNELILRNLYVPAHTMAEDLWTKISGRPGESRIKPLNFVPLREARRVSLELFGKAEDPQGRRARQVLYVKYQGILRRLLRDAWDEISNKGLHPSVVETMVREVPSEERRRLIRDAAARYFRTFSWRPRCDAFYLPYVPGQPTRCFAFYGNPTIDWLVRRSLSEDEVRRHMSLYSYIRAVKEY